MELIIPRLERYLAHHAIGKERAALFRHYRVAARKQRSDVFFRRVKRCDIDPVFHPDNGR